MAINLVSQIMEFITPDLIGRISSTLGLERGSAQKAIGASVPGLLAGLVGLTSKPEGARQLSSELDQQSPGMLESLKNLGGTSQPGALMERGTSMLSNLFGGRTLGGLSGAIGKFAGISDNSSMSLLGIIGPLVLGGLARTQRSQGLDSNGLASLLSSQKDNIAAAIPSGFGNLLSGTGLLDSVSGLVGAGGAAASAAASRARAGVSEGSYAARQAAEAASERASSSNWLYWVIPLAIVAGLAWYFLGNQGQQLSNQARNNPAPTTQTAPRTPPASSSLTVQGIDLASQLSVAVGGVRSALQSIMDPSSAQAAVPRLQEAATQLDSVTGLATQLPAEGRKALADRVAMDIPSLDQSFDTVLAKSDVAPVVQSEIDGLRTKLKALANS